MAKGDIQSNLSMFMNKEEEDEDLIDEKNSKNLNSKSKLSNYMDAIDKDEDTDIEEILDDVPKRSKSKSRLSMYMDAIDNETDEEDEDDEDNIRNCIVCGKELPESNISDICDECLNKKSLLEDLKNILSFLSPGESFTNEDFINNGYNALKANILISKLMSEKLVFLDLDGLFSLSYVKDINKFILSYGSEEDLLDENKYRNFSLANKNIDISLYSDYVKIKFNSRTRKWVVSYYNENNFLHSRSFIHSEDANKEAIRYLKQLGHLSQREVPKKEEPQKKYSKHEGIYYSKSKGKWGANVKGFRGKKFIGYFDTEEEAYLARTKYLNDKEKSKLAYADEKRGIKNRKVSTLSLGEMIVFNKKKGKWIYRYKDELGNLKMKAFDTEEEAKRAQESRNSI